MLKTVSIQTVTSNMSQFCSVYEYFILMHIHTDKSHTLKIIVLMVHP